MTLQFRPSAGWAVLWLAAIGAGAVVGLSAADERAAPSADAPAQDAGTQQAAKAALAEFNDLIGAWRGVGMPRRGSRQGAWQESAEWVWDFTQGRPALHYNIENGKLLESAVVSYDADKQLYRLRGKFADKTVRDYTGKLDGNKLVLNSQPQDGEVHRITVTQLNEKRTLVLHEKRQESQSFYARVAEVGYTRAGTSLAVEGAGQPECIVTGGQGTSTVTYKGTTYYVCCTGCRQAFEDDPETIIAEAKARGQGSGGRD